MTFQLMRSRLFVTNTQCFVASPGIAVLCSLMGLSLFSNAFAQTTESLTVESIAPGAPAWMASLAVADDFREPTSSTQLETRPYTELPLSLIKGSVYHQPAGALTGKVLFAMAGHGWTYDADKMYYFTQRGLSHGLVEDLGNADQMHIFSHLVFNAGATVVPLRPIDHQPNERVLDNMMPQVQFFGSWRAGSSDRFYGSPGDKVPYAVAAASLIENAVARYQPYIPDAGYYPVYVWAKDGTDRSNQLYRVKHSGGTAEIRVNWRQIGKAWAWLGTYYFEKGDAGYVDVSNQVIDPYEAYQGGIVVADAVRFGNGRGDVPRPGGISGFGREDEGDCYWIQRSLGVGADRLLYDIGSDGNSTVSSPPKAAAHINREKTGSYLDRLLISFHSNASSGKARGAVSLFNASAKQRPTYQEDLAELTGREVNHQLKAQAASIKDTWTDRERHTYSGINFGELRRDYLQNEMAATIVEVAFHDNAEDVAFLMDPASRIRMAEATLRGILHWYAEISAPNSAHVMPPAPPVAIAATVVDGRIKVQWKPGSVGVFEGGPVTNFRIYRSPNGYGFDGGFATPADSDSTIVDTLTTSGVTFLRLTASNGAGESLPSQTIAVCPGSSDKKKSPDTATTILLSANTVLDSTTDIPYKLGTQPGGGPYRTTAETRRVRAIYALMEPSGTGEALALAASGIGFDGADTAAFEAGLVKPRAHKRIVLTTDQQQPNSALLSDKLQSQLRSFVSNGGKLFISGSGFAQNLQASGGGSASFLSDVCGITSTDKTNPEGLIASLDDRFLPTTKTVSLLPQNRYWAIQAPISPAQFNLKKGRSIGLLQYLNSTEEGYSAALTRPTASEGEVIVLGFPLALIEDPAERTTLMQAILKQL